MLQVLRVMLLGCIAGCSANLDAECADLFEDANVVLNEVADARDSGERKAKVEKLEGFLREVMALRKSAKERLDDADFSGGLCSELSYNPMECEEHQVWDDLNLRKTMALTEFTMLWRQVGEIQTSNRRALSDPDNRTFNQLNSKTLDELMALRYLCNNTLR